MAILQCAPRTVQQGRKTIDVRILDGQASDVHAADTGLFEGKVLPPEAQYVW